MRKQFFRQTSFPLERLVQLLDGDGVVGCGGGCCPLGGMPIGLVFNELRVILLQEETLSEERVQAEQALAGALFAQQSDNARFIAFCTLLEAALTRPLSPETLEIIKKFQRSPLNNELVNEAKRNHPHLFQ